MHDILEGVFPLEIKPLLRYLVQSKLISLNDLNSKIKLFPFTGADATNIPVPIAWLKRPLPKTNLQVFQYSFCLHKLHCVYAIASQMWCFGRLLPLLFGKTIPKEDPHGKNFTACLLGLPVIKKTGLLLYDSQFKLLYPTYHLTPKMHYLIHVMRKLVLHYFYFTCT